MLDFKELSMAGTEFELLVREILFAKGLDAAWSGVGPDGGRDLICIERSDSIFGTSAKRWLIQCKHFAHSGRSVGLADVTGIIEACAQHGADGYVVATSTYVSSGLVARLESIAADRANRLATAYLDGPMMERMLQSPALFHVAQRFLPVSAASNNWVVSRTDRPNHFIINLRGYLFHLTNRIGSEAQYHFATINNRLDDIESISMPSGHFIRPRAFWYDDKNGGYSVHLDYMVPHQSSDIPYSEKSLAKALGDGDVLEDGQWYNFDVIKRRYIPTSDHYDPNHYDYYAPYIGSFLIGEGRDRSTIPDGDRGIIISSYDDDDPGVFDSSGDIVDAGATRAFQDFMDAARDSIGVPRVSSVNASPETLTALMSPGGRKAVDTFALSWRFDTASFHVSDRKSVV